MVEGIVLLASCEQNFIRVYENLVQHPSNNISIIMLNVQNIEFKTTYYSQGLTLKP